MRARRLTPTALVTLGVLAGALLFSSAPALAAGPSIVSESAPSPKAEEARLEALVNPHNETTECHFQYGTEPSLATHTTVPCESESISGEEQGVGVNVSGLAQNTIYHYRVVLKSVGGTADGTPEPFTTALRPEKPVTLTQELVTGTTATLKGELNPGVTAKDGYYFAYDNNGTCEPAFTTTPGVETTETKRAVSTPVTGLEGSTEYKFCVVATNSVGEATPGLPLTFKTLAEKPKVESEGSSSPPPTPFDATLEGQVNPENQKTTYYLEYATPEAKLGTEEAKTLAFGGVGSGVSSNQPVGPVDLGGGLTPNTTYYYRVVAKNPTGEVKGTVESFKTLPAEKPSVTGERLVGAGLGTDTIEAQLNPDYQGVSSCEVQYVLKTTYEATGFATGVTGAGCTPERAVECGIGEVCHEFGMIGSPEPFTATLGGLEEGKAYEYRIFASNAIGTFYGAPQALLRMSPHITGASEVSEVTQHAALIKPSTIDPEIEAPLEATYYILYGTGEPGEQRTARTTVGSGLAPNAVAPVQLYGLQPGTTYHYAVVAYNGNATTTGSQQTFTTAAADPLTPPVVGSQSARFVNENSAVIEGEVNPGGGETTYAVQYGTSTAYGSSGAGPTTLAPNTTAQGTITALTGLAPGTTYHYRIVVSNGAGTGYGPDATFPTTGAARIAAFTSFTIPTVPLIATTPAVFPAEGPVAAGTTPKALTRAQKLARALKACGKQAKGKRAGCKKQAHAKYGPAKRKKK
jgi:hypothetical protein